MAVEWNGAVMQRYSRPSVAETIASTLLNDASKYQNQKQDDIANSVITRIKQLDPDQQQQAAEMAAQQYPWMKPILTGATMQGLPDSSAQMLAAQKRQFLSADPNGDQTGIPEPQRRIAEYLTRQAMVTGKEPGAAVSNEMFLAGGLGPDYTNALETRAKLVPTGQQEARDAQMQPYEDARTAHQNAAAEAAQALADNRVADDGDGSDDEGASDSDAPQQRKGRAPAPTIQEKQIARINQGLMKLHEQEVVGVQKYQAAKAANDSVAKAKAIAELNKVRAAIQANMQSRDSISKQVTPQAQQPAAAAPHRIIQRSPSTGAVRYSDDGGKTWVQGQ